MKNETRFADHLRTTRDLASSRLKNSWDTVFLCDCCQKALSDLAEREAAPEPQPELNLKKPRQVYFIGGADGPIKIGIATNPAARIKELQTGHPHPLAVLAATRGDQAMERALHKRFARHRLQGEWFKRHPDILNEISKLNSERLAA